MKKRVMICATPCFGLTKGKHYEILNEIYDYPEENSLVSIVCDTGSEYMYYRNRFITYEQWKVSLKNMLKRNTIQRVNLKWSSGYSE
jgi:hypothetical protein